MVENGSKDIVGVASKGGKVHDVAVRTLKSIETLGLKPVPQVYELWFRYFQGDPEIVRAIDDHKGILDEVACHKIYKTYLSEAAKDDAVKKMGAQLQAAVGEIVYMLSSVKSAASDYGATLSDVGGKIKHAETIEDLSHLVSVIMKDTKEMVAKNQSLEIQLVNSSQQLTELRQNIDSIRKEAMLDGLTGLYNRKAFDRHINDCIEESLSTNRPLSLLMLDIDHFKKFNDTFGHQFGDQVLKLVAHSLTEGIKGRDIASRYGGEEFAIILPNTNADSAARLADTLASAIGNKELVSKSSQVNMGQVTLSIGVAEYNREENTVDFINRADASLYQAKRDGRNCIRVAED